MLFGNSLVASLSHLLARQRSKIVRLAPRRRRGAFEQLESRALLTTATGDFNGDGFADLIIGMPGDTVAGQTNAGRVQVIYGSADGLTAVRTRYWSELSVGILGDPGTGDRFGAALAAGDFNGDGFDDLAIGKPGEAVGGKAAAGSVHILYGTPLGLAAKNNQVFSRDSAYIVGVAATGDRFGSALAAGDFDNDGIDDLAIGAPQANPSGLNNAGAVNIIYGRLNGLRAVDNQQWHLDSQYILGVAQANDLFGSALAVGDFNADRRDDLAIGIPNRDIGGSASEGAVRMLYGGANHLGSAGNQFLNQDAGRTPGTGETDDLFGAALAGGDFNGDRRLELAVFVPGEPGSGAFDGGVNVYLGGVNSLNTSSGMQLWERGDNTVFFSLEEKNRREGEAFLLKNRLEPGVITTASGLQYKELKFGQGDKPGPNSQVRVNYKGTLIDGTQFDAGTNAQFGVNGVVDGFAEALQLMREGDKWMIYLPSELAYGETGTGQFIGPNAVIIFELELLEVLP